MTNTYLDALGHEREGVFLLGTVSSNGTVTLGNAGGGTQFAAGTVAGNTDTGTIAIVVRDDSLATLTPADNQYTVLRVDSTGALWAHLTDNMVPGTGVSNLGKAVGNAQTNTDVGVALLAVRDDVLSTRPEADGTYTNLRTDSLGNLMVNAGAGPAQYAEDAAHVSGDFGQAVWAVRQDASASTSGSSGDYSAFTVDANGKLWAIAAQSGTWTVQPGNTQNTTPWAVGSVNVIIAVTPTLDTSAYASGDSLHTTIMTFAAAVRANGLTGLVTKLVVVDKAVQSAAGELWLFDTAVTPAAANAAHSITDAHAALCIGVIPFGPYYASALNSVSINSSIRLPFKAASADTSIYGIAVTRGTPTYAASDLVFTLQIAQD